VRLGVVNEHQEVMGPWPKSPRAGPSGHSVEITSSIRARTDLLVAFFRLQARWIWTDTLGPVRAASAQPMTLLVAALEKRPPAMNRPEQSRPVRSPLKLRRTMPSPGPGGAWTSFRAPEDDASLHHA
jgi:hypothetical protein